MVALLAFVRGAGIGLWKGWVTLSPAIAHRLIAFDINY
jgi:hypothetical protein